MRSRTLLRLSSAALLVTGGASSCARGDGARGGAEGDAEAWRLDPVARIDVGDRDEGDSVVFSRVTDARLLPNGMLVVADGGGFAVRFFDARGTLVRSVGRRGRGPAEFSGGLQLGDAAGDSVAVWDAGQARWTIVSSTTGGARQVFGDFAVPVWVHAGVEIHSAIAVPPAWVPVRLASLAGAGPPPRLAHLDETAVLWIRTEPSRAEWRAFVDTAGPVGTLRLPTGAQLLHVSRDAVVSLVADSLGLERVVVHGLSRGAHLAPALTPLAVAPVDSGGRSTLMSAMRFAVVAQEMHFAEHGAYTGARDSLKLEMPEGTQFRLVEVTDRGWRGVGYFTSNGYSCGMIIGLAAPAGWTEGEVRCGW